MKKRKITDIDETVIREDTRIALQKASEMKTLNEEDPYGVARGMSSSAKPGILSRLTKGLMWNPVTKAAQASAALGQLATGTQTGRDLGKKIGDTFPSLKKAAGEFKQYRDTELAPKVASATGLPIKSLSTAAETPYISNAAKDVKDMVAPEPNKSVKDLARRGKPEMPAQSKGEQPKKIEPVTTKEPGTLSAPVPKAPEAPKTPAPGTSQTAQTFKQAFAAARKEAGGGKGQFEYKGTKYQTNIQGTGTKEKPQEKFISMDKQKVTSVKVPSTPAAPSTPKADTKAPETMMTTNKGPSLDAAAKVGITQADTEKGQGLSAVSQVGKQPAAPKSPETPAAPQAPKSPADTAPIDGRPKINAPAPVASDKSTEPAQFGDQPGVKYPEKKSVNESVVSVGSNRYRIL